MSASVLWEIMLDKPQSILLREVFFVFFPYKYLPLKKTPHISLNQIEHTWIKLE